MVILCQGMWLLYVQDFWSFYVGVCGCLMFKTSGHFMSGYVVASCSRLLVILWSFLCARHVCFLCARCTVILCCLMCRACKFFHVQDMWSLYVQGMPCFFFMCRACGCFMFKPCGRFMCKACSCFRGEHCWLLMWVCCSCATAQEGKMCKHQFVT